VATRHNASGLPSAITPDSISSEAQAAFDESLLRRVQRGCQVHRLSKDCAIKPSSNDDLIVALGNFIAASRIKAIAASEKRLHGSVCCAQAATRQSPFIPCQMDLPG
jgi:hypothetical protein